MAITLKGAIVNNPSSAGTIINQITALVGANTLAQVFVVPTAQQYQYEIIVSTT